MPSYDYSYYRACKQHECRIDDTRESDTSHKFEIDTMWCPVGKHVIKPFPYSWHKADSWVVMRSDGKEIAIVTGEEYELCGS